MPIYDDPYLERPRNQTAAERRALKLREGVRPQRAVRPQIQGPQGPVSPFAQGMIQNAPATIASLRAVANQGPALPPAPEPKIPSGNLFEQFVHSAAPDSMTPPRDPKTLAMQSHVADLEAVRNRLRDIGRPTSTEMMLAPPGVPYHGSVTHGVMAGHAPLPPATMTAGYNSARPIPGPLAPPLSPEEALRHRVTALANQGLTSHEQLPEPNPEMTLADTIKNRSQRGGKSEQYLQEHLKAIAQATGKDMSPGAMQIRMGEDKVRRQGMLAENIKARNNPTMAALEQISKIGGNAGGGFNPAVAGMLFGPDAASSMAHTDMEREHYKNVERMQRETLELQRGALAAGQPGGQLGHEAAVRAAGSFDLLPPEEQKARLTEILQRHGNDPEAAAPSLAGVGLTPQRAKELAEKMGLPGPIPSVFAGPLNPLLPILKGIAAWSGLGAPIPKVAG